MFDSIGNIVTLVTLALTLILSFSEIRRRKAESDKSEADSDKSKAEAAETLTDSVLKLLIPKDEEISNLNKKLSALTAQIVVMEEDRHNERLNVKKEIDALTRQINDLTSQHQFLIGELKRSDTALEYLAALTQSTFPKETEQAIKIRRGQLIETPKKTQTN